MPHRNPLGRRWLPTLSVAAAVVIGATGTAAAQSSPPSPPSPPSPVATRPLTDAIKVSAGETCLDEGRLQRRIARWLERDAIDARISILVSGGPAPTDVRFVVKRRGEAPAERILDAVPQPCDQLHAAVALSIALSIDATLLGQEEVSDDEALGDEPPPVAPPPGPLAALQPRDEELAFRPQLSMALAGGLASGLVAGEAPVGRLWVAFSPFPWVDLRLGAVGARGAARGFERAPGRYEADLYAGRLDLCLVARVAGEMRLSGCLGGQVGVFATRGDDSFPGGGQVQSSMWSAAVAGVAVQVAISGPLGLGLDLDLNAPLAARRVQIDDGGGTALAFEELPPLAFAATLGPVLTFGL